MTDIYDRQRELALNIPDSVAVLGVGGIGSWVALFFSLAGVPEIVIVDPDVLEFSNLNRTPFRADQAGMEMYKVYALEELIKERRLDTEVIAIPDVETEDVQEILRNVDLIVDCRDGEKFFDDEELQKKVIAKLGYDGLSMTVVWNPEPGHGWGEDVRYTVTPSYLVPPVMLAAMVVDAVLNRWVPDGYKKVYYKNPEEVF